MTADAHFAAGWLRRREPLDAAARGRSAVALGLDRWLAALPRIDGVLHGADLGCGLGANLRWLAPRIGGAQAWDVFDHDAALLAQWPAGAGIEPAPITIRRHPVDLASPLDTIIPARAGLVTASAWLDLVSAPWLAGFVQLLQQRTGCHALLALSVDGRIDWQPHDEADILVQACFEAHQHRDKGFGPALGAQASGAAERLFTAAGFDVRCADADWDVPAALQPELIAGMAAAAIEQRPDLQPVITAWRERRAAWAAHTRLCIGHRDLIASPPAR